ncbi:TIGR04222 domain-containing membrane protein [Kitasatospora sp. NPDC101801]|uniref:TIGR04222 domain-containing membrane protein n=1 Tax=Kitasatospora sp. NPDC101801 TaxID=3364103 RepID=UPI00380B2DD4
MIHMQYAELVTAISLLAATGLWAAVADRRLKHPRNRQRTPQNGLPLLEVAYLAGGPVRVADTVLARMEQEGRLIVPRFGQATLTDRTSHDPVEADLIRVVGPSGRAHPATLRRAVLTSHQLGRIDRRLTDRGLLHEPRRLRAARRAHRLLIGALGLAAALAVTAVVRRLLAPGEGLLPLLAFLVLLPAGLLHRHRTAPGRGRLTRAGREQLEHLRTGTARPGSDRAAAVPSAARLRAARPSTPTLGSAPNSGEQHGSAIAELVLYGTLAEDPADWSADSGGTAYGDGGAAYAGGGDGCGSSCGSGGGGD